MKNQIILMAAAALAFASCSKDEMTEVNPGNAISFQSAVTRSTDITTGNLADIYVSALYTTEQNANPLTSGKPYFHKVHFTKQQSGSTAWISTPQYYWPSSGYLTFVAWAPAAINDLIGNITDQSTALPEKISFTPDSNVANQIDFVGAISSSTQAPSTSAVNLTFHHELSKIVIKAKNTNSAYTYKVAGVRIGHVMSSAKFILANATTTGAWSADGATYGSYTIDYSANGDGAIYTLDGTPTSIMDAKGTVTSGQEGTSAKLIPQSLTAWNKHGSTSSTGSYISVKVNITTHDGAQVFPRKGTYAWVSVPVKGSWSKGNQYTYVLDFSNGAGWTDPDTDSGETGSNPGEQVLGNSITFTVSETPWAPEPGHTDGSETVPMKPQQGQN